MGVRLTVRVREFDLESDQARYEFEQDRIRIGRALGSDVFLPHTSVSHRHASIEQRGGRYVLIDHGSTNGTRINGQPLVPERGKALRDDDEISVGTFTLLWKEGVPVTHALNQVRTLSLARRLLTQAERSDPSPPSLRVLNGPLAGTVVPLPEPPSRFIIGRGESCDLAVPDADASREHVELLVGVDGVEARDLGSKNGLSVNERRVVHRALEDRDELLVGATLLAFDDPAAAALAAALDEPDVVFAPPPDSPKPAVLEDHPDAPTGEIPATMPPPPPSVLPPPRPTGVGAEALVYFLAIVVLLASLSGLYLLLGGEP
jgi:pSer/pThr/pTyr-binding forkhead associated (FHA) protein